jgi:hypothetical protein
VRIRCGCKGMWAWLCGRAGGGSYALYQVDSTRREAECLVLDFEEVAVREAA